MDHPRAKKAVKKVRPVKKAKKANKGKAKDPPETINPRPKHYHFWFNDTGFNILPKILFHPTIASHLTQVPQNFTKRIDFLQKEFPTRDLAPHIPAETDIHWIEWSKAKSTAMRKAINKITRARFLFRILLHHARTRRLQIANTEDIFTMEVPKRPVYIVDWASRQKYTFEAQTLMKDITCRLMTHDGLFENPQEPRNPYTNIPFTQSQMISAWNSIFSTGIYTSSAFALFRKCKFCISRFILENITFLKVNALYKTMNDPGLYDYSERMIDFIRYAYDEEGVDLRINIYTHAMVNYPQHPLLKKWAALCYKFYEVDLLYNTAPLVLNLKKSYILDSTIDLINCEKQLCRLYTIPDDLGISVEEANMAILDVYVILDT
jgi:hypothetical protein